VTRPLRRLVADGWYHVFGRGNERRAIFAGARDREHFLELLAAISERYGVRVHAYGLMDNHYHAVLQTPEANLSAAMQWFHGSYSAWYNAKHARVGPLFQGRYRALPVENGAWAYTLSLYVHLNPLRIAGLGLDKRGRVAEGKGWRAPTAVQVTERLRRLRSYPWSSYRAYAGYEPAPGWLETATLLGRAHGVPERRHAAYRQEARRMLSHGVDASRLERLRDAVAIGSAEFASQIRRLAAEGSLEGISGKRELRRRVPVAKVRKAVEALMGAPWEAFRDQYGNWGCALFLWGVRQVCGLSLRETGRQAGGMHFSTVSTAIRRLSARAAENASLRELQSRMLKLANDEP
jgi:REP element-mobilizing transposase RayT